MNRKRFLALASAFVTLSGALSLTQPARASEADVFGCTLEEYSSEIHYAHEACRAMGYDGGRVIYCDGKYAQHECFNVIEE